MFSVFQCNSKKTPTPEQQTQHLNSLWYLHLSNGRLQASQQWAEQTNVPETANGSHSSGDHLSSLSGHGQLTGTKHITRHI